MGLQGGKKLRFAKNINIDGMKRIKLNDKPNTTSTKTSVVVFNDKYAGIHNIGNKLPDFVTAISNGDSPSVEIARATVLEKPRTLGTRR